MKAMTKGVISALAFLGVSTSAYADDWAGFYKGIDDVDGSEISLMITSDKNGTYDIRMTTPALGRCDSPNTPGLILATGRVEGDRLVRTNVRYKCDGQDDFTSAPDGQYVKHDENVILIETVTGRRNFYHRIRGD